MKGIKIEIEEKVIAMSKTYGKNVEKYAEEYFRNKGYTVTDTGKYDLLLKSENHKERIKNNNKIIEDFLKSIGKQKELEFLKKINELREGRNSGQPDIFAYKNENDWFFAEIKSDKDKLSEDQKIVFALFKVILGCTEKNLRIIRVTTKQDYNAAGNKERTENFIVTLNAADIK